MKQYLDLGREILQTQKKDSARENMPTTLSKFGHQMRFDLREGFPIVTTKEINFKNIVVELLWFLRGDSNIRFLVDNGCNIWNEDAYNYYKKIITKYCNDQGGEPPLGVVFEDIPNNRLRPYTFEEFVEIIKTTSKEHLPKEGSYILGDCGKQYGWLWRKWKGEHIFGDGEGEFQGQGNRYISGQREVDQIKVLIKGLKEKPTSRRHILTAWNPLTLDDMALPACHSFVQFNCRPLTAAERVDKYNGHADGTIVVKQALGDYKYPEGYVMEHDDDIPEPLPNSFYLREDEEKFLDSENIPRYYLDCQMYQRSADYFLGVPYNIASYALLTHIIAKIVGMIPGDLVHSLGDVHIYSNHIDKVEQQIQRQPHKLPTLEINSEFWKTVSQECGTGYFDESVIPSISVEDFKLLNYTHEEKIFGKLSTGMRR